MAAFGCVAWMAQVVLVFLILRRAFGDWTAALGALALLLGCAGSDVRVSLETNQVVALNLGALWMAMDSRWRSAALLAALAVLFRPDALVFGLPLAVVCIYEKRAKSLGPALIFLAVLAPWMLFATYYYGSPLPMSAVTKFQRVGIPVYAEHILDHLGAFVWPDKPAVTWLLWVLGVAGALRLFKRGRWYAFLAIYPFADYADPAKKRFMTSIIFGTSAAAATSRQECIESMGLPTSTVRMPSSAAVIGPMVLPQPRSDRTTKRCVVTSASRAQRSKLAQLSPSVA